MLAMSVCTHWRDWIWDAEQGFRLVETGLQLQGRVGLFPSSPSHSIEKLLHMTYLLGWGRVKQARVTRLHCTRRDVHASSRNGKFTSGGGQACRSVWYGGGQAQGGHSRYRDYIQTCSILGESATTRVRHCFPWCWDHWVFDIGCVPAGGVACQEGHNLQFGSLDTRTENRHATRDDVSRNTLGNLQAMLLKQVCKAWSCHLHRERCNTSSRCWDCPSRWEVRVTAGVFRSASLGLFPAAHPAASDEYCRSWLESPGERQSRCYALRSSARSSTIDCALSCTQATLSCRQQHSRDVFRRTWTLRDPVYPPLRALAQCRLARCYPGLSLLTCVSHHQSAMFIPV